MNGLADPELDTLDSRVGQHVAAIVETARAAPPGGGHAWDRLLAFYGVTPDTTRGRFEQVQRLRLRVGAVPSEVRRALAAMVSQADGELRRIASRMPGGAQIATIADRLSRLVEEEGARYERSARGERVASVFANAAETSKQVPWAGQAIEPTLVLACPSCGAPQERPLDFRCRYCHAPMVRSAEEQ
jgi:hypothetical protein